MKLTNPFRTRRVRGGEQALLTVAKVVGTALAAGVAVVIARELPTLRRYIRMERM
jgi:hypothetical protein